MTPDHLRWWAATETLAVMGATFTGLGLAEGFGNDRRTLGGVLAGFGLLALALFAARVWLWRTRRWPR